MSSAVSGSFRALLASHLFLVIGANKRQNAFGEKFGGRIHAVCGAGNDHNRPEGISSAIDSKSAAGSQSW
jgi:hypothetical protein